MACESSRLSPRALSVLEDIRLFRDELLVQVPKLAANDHIHTDTSDGDMPLEDAAWVAWNCGFKDICITDHNAFGLDPGNSRHMRIAESFAPLGMRIRPGIEISCQSIENKEVHIVGLNVQPVNKIVKRMAQLQASRNEGMIETLERIRRLGYSVASFEELAGRYPNVTMSHIAKSVKNKNGISVDADAFKKAHLWPGKDCYMSKDLPSPEEGIELIRIADGRPVLAHPRATFGPKRFDWDFEGEARQFVRMDIAGIECETKTQTAAGCRRVDNFCQRYGLESLAASDAHSRSDYLVYMRQMMDVYWGTSKNMMNRWRIERQDY